MDKQLTEMLSIIDQLDEKGKRDVLRFSLFLVWWATGNPAPPVDLFLGFWEYARYKFSEACDEFKKRFPVFFHLAKKGTNEETK